MKVFSIYRVVVLFSLVEDQDEMKEGLLVKHMFKDLNKSVQLLETKKVNKDLE